MSLKTAISNLQNEIERAGIDPINGVGDDLFLMVTSLTHIVNVDLLIEKDGEILYAWRDDSQCGKGWHLPGGCLRLKETLEKRLHLCAMDEIGSDVNFNMNPVLITENIEPIRDKGRTHFISFLYRCELQDESALENLDGAEIKGHLGWFSCIPKNFLAVQDFYRNFLTDEFNQGRE